MSVINSFKARLGWPMAAVSLSFKKMSSGRRSLRNVSAFCGESPEFATADSALIWKSQTPGIRGSLVPRRGVFTFFSMMPEKLPADPSKSFPSGRRSPIWNHSTTAQLRMGCLMSAEASGITLSEGGGGACIPRLDFWAVEEAWVSSRKWRSWRDFR